MSSPTSALCARPLGASRAVIAVAALLATGAAFAGPPDATFWYSVGGAAPIAVSVAGTTSPNGNASYAGEISAANQSWKITYSYSGDLLCNPQASLNGIVSIMNYSNSTLAFSCGIEVPLCPEIEGGSVVGGVAKVTLIANGPGAITCDGAPVVQMRADESPVASLFHCPFQLAATGSGTVSTDSIFGLPGPSASGPRSAKTIGAQHKLKLTPQDVALVQVTFLLKAADGWVAPECPSDLNGDGAVDGDDLTILFQFWARTSSCVGEIPADINGDGIVNGTDLKLLLSNWGDC